MVSGLLAVRPLAHFMQQQARTLMIKRAESIGVQWTQQAEQLRQRGPETWSQELSEIQDPSLDYPSYYLQPFHAYETGNLSWAAATEVEVAAYAAHAQIWDKAGDPQGDARLRDSFHQILRQQVPDPPQRILDLGCSVGMSTAALQSTYPDAQVTGLDLSPYFLTVARHRHQSTQPILKWVHAAAEQTPFANGQFDLVSSCLMFHELPQSATRAILAEARRLLSPGGVLAIMDMNPQSEAFQKLPPYIFTLLKSTEPYLDEYFTLDLAEAIGVAGFQSPQVWRNSPRHRTLIASVEPYSPP